MGDRLDRVRGFEEDPEVLRILWETWERQGHCHYDSAEAVRGIHCDFRSESTGFLKQFLRDRGLQIEPVGRHTTRWGFVEDRRQHTPEFHRVPRGHQDERKISTELYGPSECAIVCGVEQSRQDLRRQVWPDQTLDRYPSHWRDDSDKSLQHSFESYRFRARGYRTTLSGRLPQSR
jgi:hypothetical protein